MQGRRLIVLPEAHSPSTYVQRGISP